MAQTLTELANTEAAPLRPELQALLSANPFFACLEGRPVTFLNGAQERHFAPDEIVSPQGSTQREFYLLLQGSVHVFYNASENDTAHLMATLPIGTSFGEVQLLTGFASTSTVRAAEHSIFLCLTEDLFWNLLNHHPAIRREILGNLSIRLAKVHSATAQQEKMASLGTMAASLMHELNNPGTAARRASTQLRDNLTRMHKLSAKWARMDFSAAQKQCIYDLQEYALSTRPHVSLNSLEQADAEETLIAWMEQAAVEDAWKLAPTFVSIHMDSTALACTYTTIPEPFFSDVLSWLEAMISSMQLVGTIEESIGRVTELVAAVKSYAYESRGQKQALDVNRSIHATLVILGHKVREKQITLEKSLAPNLPTLTTDCGGLNQIWTNLLDNAIDAAPAGGHIVLKTWAEPSSLHPHASDLCILVSDNGAGIPPQTQPHIFDAFYTTKPAGIGTGLGLGIVHRIVEQIGGTILFSSVPGETEFVVRLPAARS